MTKKESGPARPQRLALLTRTAEWHQIWARLPEEREPRPSRSCNYMFGHLSVLAAFDEDAEPDDAEFDVAVDDEALADGLAVAA